MVRALESGFTSLVSPCLPWWPSKPLTLVLCLFVMPSWK